MLMLAPPYYVVQRSPWAYFHKRPQNIAIRQYSARETRHHLYSSSFSSPNLFATTPHGCVSRITYIYTVQCDPITPKHQTARQRDFPASSHLALAVRCPDWLAVAAQSRFPRALLSSSDIYPVSLACLFFLLSFSVYFSFTASRSHHEYIHAYCDTTVIRSPRALIRY